MDSPFYQPPPPLGDPIPAKASKPLPLTAPGARSGPTKQELEDWYQELDSLTQGMRPGHLLDRLLDLRDELYRHLL